MHIFGTFSHVYSCLWLHSCLYLHLGYNNSTCVLENIFSILDCTVREIVDGGQFSRYPVVFPRPYRMHTIQSRVFVTAKITCNISSILNKFIFFEKKVDILLRIKVSWIYIGPFHKITSYRLKVLRQIPCPALFLTLGSCTQIKRFPLGYLESQI